ncbi:virulence-associated protein E [Modicisalibacter xianhensis]|uniref:Virulence-associated protein E n=1 Tax=Modicisalibacter xianhensis TaxID=442341 RepID=A0A4R8FHG7_9GAMM|nr:virulence-associated E family protein [Halomonas xianhensis]TDX21601.1 virulence-associated protein E [Halomonas xianhensis]
MTDSITLLRAHGRQCLAKRFDGSTWHDYSRAKHFKPSREPVANLDELATLLDNLLTDRQTCVIRGQLRKDVSPDSHPHLFDKQGRVARQLLSFADKPHHWVMFDVDGFEPSVDPVARAEDAILEWIGKALPECFHDVGFYWQLSSRAGFSRALKAHVWFWLDSTYDSETLREWAKAEDLDVDTSTFNPVQVHYTAAPKFEEGALDPVAKRSGRFESWLGADSVPLVIDPDVVEQAREKVRNGEYKMPDPTQKPGWIGAFCRAYSIDDILDDFLPHVFERHDDAGVLNFLLGSGAPRGAFVMGDGKHIVNTHASDPFNRHATNAFDLVRYYLHDGEEDDPSEEVFKTSSYQAMSEWCAKDPRTRQYNISEDDYAAQLFSSVVPELPDDIPNDDAAMDEASERGSEDPADNQLLRLLKAPDIEGWTQFLEMSQKTAAVLDTAMNIKLILCGDPALRGRICLNTFHNEIRAFDTLPWRAVRDKVNGEIWDDADDHQLIDYITRHYRIEPQRQRITHAVTVVANLDRRHPVRRYLRRLEWDGVPRLDTWLQDYLGVEDCEYVRQAGAKTLIAGVARVMEPGCKFDHALIIEGEQGSGKSTAVATLAGAWFTDNLPSMTGKDSVEALGGSWIVEMGELTAMTKAAVEDLKAFISRQTDRMRPAYGMHVKDYPRQCIFIGTTNQSEYLADETGNRRFWPVKSTRVDNAGFKEVRDQLWAEAFQRYIQGESRFLEGEAAEQAREAQEERYVEDDITGLVKEWLDGGPGVGGFPAEEPREGACLLEIYRAVFTDSQGMPNPQQKKAIKRVMRKMPGWSNTTAKNPVHIAGMGTQRVYYRLGGSYDPGD